METAESFIRAGWDHLIRGEYEEYGNCLSRAKACLDPAGDRRMEGELMLLYAMIQIQQLEKAEPILEAAYAMLEGRSRLYPEGSEIPHLQLQPFAIFAREAGTVDEVSVRLRRVMKLLREMTGLGGGISELYDAQLGFYRGDLVTSQENAKVAFDRASESGQKITTAYAAYYLCNIARHKRSILLWNTYTDVLRELEQEAPPAGMLALLLRCNLQLSLASLNHIPRWIKEERFGNIPHGKGWCSLANGVHKEFLMEAKMVYLEYLVYSGQYEKALWRIQEAERLLEESDNLHLLTSVYIQLYRGICYHFLGMDAYAKEAAQLALEQVAPDGLWQIPAELVCFFEKTVMEAAALYDGAEETIRRMADDLRDRVLAVRRATIGSDEAIPFTERELMVVDCLRKGAASRIEIATTLCISEHTVKRHLENIYRKTGTTNQIKIVEYARMYRLDQQKFRPNP